MDTTTYGVLQLYAVRKKEEENNCGNSLKPVIQSKSRGDLIVEIANSYLDFVKFSIAQRGVTFERLK